LRDLKQFIDAMEAVKDTRVVVAVASHVHVDVANKELSSLSCKEITLDSGCTSH